jgi:serine/threonine protein kinase
MALTIGTRIGPYEVTAQIGVGGMGEVYRATDTNLGRQVAIKVLPDTFAHDPERLARFEREAKTLATLNHSNVAQIHGFEKADGIRALVMELVEGPTLADRIAQGPIPIDEALPIAKQICEALEAAHERGVIHRDLKPANIKLRSDGTVKVLDFGLAKAFEPISAPVDATASPTVTSPALMTGVGVLLGTVAYMSPEQARGKPVDKRSDIWAFGCVLYEMLTARRAFDGDDVSETLAAVLRAEPDWGALPPSIPTNISKALRWCLEKDRQRRLRDISDARMLLEEASTAPDLTQAHALRKVRVRERIAWAVVAAMLLVTVSLAVRSQRDSPIETATTRFSVVPPPNITLSISLAQLSAVLSPDGRRLVFAATGATGPSLWVRDLDSLEARPIAGTSGARYPFWSPDSRTIAFFADGRLKAVAASGSPVQSLSDAPIGMGGAWSREGLIVFAGAAAGGLSSVPAAGGQPRQLTAVAGSFSHRFPSFLPDGRHFLYLVYPSNQIYVGSVDSADTTQLLSAESQAQFASPGFVLFTRQNTLLAQPFDATRAALTGEAFPIVEQTPADANNFAAFSVSENGNLAYRVGGSDTTQLTWFDRAGNAVGTAGPPGRYRNPVLSPDSARVAVDVVESSGRSRDIWILELARGVLSRFTFDNANEIMPIWSPDGSRIAFGSDREDGTSSIYQKPSDGSGAEELLFRSTTENATPYGWSPDGRFIIHRYMVGGFFNSGVLPLTGDRRPRLYQSESFVQSLRDISPDGRWVAYQSNESGRFEVFVQTFPMPGGKRQVSSTGGVAPIWRDDGNELFYYALDGQLMAVPIRREDQALQIGAPAPLFRARMLLGPSASMGFNQQYDVMPHGQRFLLNVPVEDSTAGAGSAQIVVVQHFDEELKRLVPN